MTKETKVPHAQADSDILSLLKDSDNPHERAVLSVMLQMTQALKSNTDATEAIARGFHVHVSEFHNHRLEFESHVKDELQLFAQGRGMQKVLSWAISSIGMVMTVIMAMGLYILNGHVIGSAQERELNTAQEKKLTILEQQPRVLRGEFEDLRNRVFINETQIDLLKGQLGFPVKKQGSPLLGVKP